MVDIVSRDSRSLNVVAAVVALSLGPPVSADAQGDGASTLPPTVSLDRSVSGGPE